MGTAGKILMEPGKALTGVQTHEKSKLVQAIGLEVEVIAADKM